MLLLQLNSSPSPHPAPPLPPILTLFGLRGHQSQISRGFICILFVFNIVFSLLRNALNTLICHRVIAWKQKTSIKKSLEQKNTGAVRQMMEIMVVTIIIIIIIVVVIIIIIATSINAIVLL